MSPVTFLVLDRRWNNGTYKHLHERTFPPLWRRPLFDLTPSAVAMVRAIFGMGTLTMVMAA
jgi:hypothetical protein